MKILLNVPFVEKDAAKALGAQWNPALKKWWLDPHHLEDGDLTPFTPWLPKMSGNGPMTTLTAEKIEAAGNSGIGFTAKQLAVLGVRWPPSKGWKSSLIGTQVPQERYEKFLSLRKKRKERKPGSDTSHMEMGRTEPPGGFTPLCDCTTPRWEHCPHSLEMAESRGELPPFAWDEAIQAGAP